jgi:hypothetical protein
MSPTAAKAIVLPSGESAGLTTPSTCRGATDVKSRFRRVYIVAARVTVIVAVKGTTSTLPPSALRLWILPSET